MFLSELEFKTSDFTKSAKSFQKTDGILSQKIVLWRILRYVIYLNAFAFICDFLEVKNYVIFMAFLPYDRAWNTGGAQKMSGEERKKSRSATWKFMENICLSTIYSVLFPVIAGSVDFCKFKLHCIYFKQIYVFRY